MKAIESLPDLEWSELATEEIASFGTRGVQLSLRAVQVDDICAAGLYYPTLTDSPWLWFLLTKHVTIRRLIRLRDVVDEIPIGTKTAIDESLPHCVRFAKFFGFRPTEELWDKYRVYRRY